MAMVADKFVSSNLQ